MKKRSTIGSVLVAVCILGSLIAQRAWAGGQGCAPQHVHRPHPAPGTQYGLAVALAGEWAAVGAPSDYTLIGFNPGAVYTYRRIGREWIPDTRFTGQDSATGDTFGRSLALDGSRLVVGAPSHNPSFTPHAGAAYLFERQNGDWVQAAKLSPPTAQTGAGFGWSVAMQGDSIVVGSPIRHLVGFESGAVYVLREVSGVWTVVETLSGAQHQWGDRLGTSVAIDGDWIVSGGIGIDGIQMNSGGAFVWQRTPNGWVESSRLVPWDNGGHPSSLSSGWAVAVAGNRVALGAHSASVNALGAGAVYIFEYDQGAWRPLTKVVAPQEVNDLRAGKSLSMSGERLLVGADGNDEGIISGGAAYLYEATPDGYRFIQKFRSPDPQVSAFFSIVAYDQGTALIGAWNADVPCAGGTCNDAGDAWFFEAPTFVEGFCFGGACPCGNPDPARGCANSGGSGANLVACGSGSLAADDLVLTAERLPASQPVLLFSGSGPIPGGQGISFGDGLRCVGGGLVRLSTTQSNPAGRASFGPGLAQLAPWPPAQPHHMQAWYRDPAPSPCGSSFNTTHALAIELGP